MQAALVIILLLAIFSLELCSSAITDGSQQAMSSCLHGAG